MFRPIRMDHTNCLQVAIKTLQKKKNSLVPDMTDDNLEACMTKTQDLIQDTINNLFAMTEKLTRMKNSIKTTGDDELYGKTPRSVLELNYKFLEM